MRTGIALVAALTLLPGPLAGACRADGPRVLTDADLVTYAAKPYDKRAMMERTVTLGLHHGAPVVADFPCSDICPDYTTRIIHYGVAPGAACERLGGVTVTRSVPYSIAVIEKQFCVPRVLAGKP